jgi:multiple sugar transport system substrate-binding protein
MTVRSAAFRIAIRKFAPFEAAIHERWASFRRESGCPLRLEAEALDLHELHDALFARDGLKRGDWDVGFVVTDWLAEAEGSGALADLAGKLQAHPPDDYPHGWTGSLLRHQRFGDAVLGLPYHDGPECLVYRKDLLAAAGAQPPRTWEEFHALARRLTSPTEKRWGTVFAAYPDGHNTVYDFCLQLWTRGGELFGADGRMRLTTPAAEAALAFYRAILADAAAIHPDCRRLDSVQSGLAFARGEVAMMINWFGFAALGETLPESRIKGQVGVAPIPLGVSLNVYWLLGIGAGSPHAEVAYRFLRHCASAEGDRLLTLGGGIGCRRSTWNDPEVLRVIPFYPALETLHAHARELPRLGHWPQLAAVIDRLVTAAVDTAQPISILLAQAQREAEKIP